jgi:hypothetical protein
MNQKTFFGDYKIQLIFSSSVRKDLMQASVFIAAFILQLSVCSQFEQKMTILSMCSKYE